MSTEIQTTTPNGSNGSALAPAPSAFEGLNPIVRQMLAQNPSPDTLEKLLALQGKWDAENARKSFVAALTAAKAEMPTVIGKDKTVDFRNKEGVRTHYKHTSLAAVIEAATAALSKHGLSLSWRSRNGKDGVTVIAVLMHVDGHTMESDPLVAPPDDSGRKSAAQAIASTTTLLERYTAQALLGLASGDMDEDQPSDAPSENSAEKQKLDEVLLAMANAQDSKALNAAWAMAKNLPEKMRDRAWKECGKHANRLGAKRKGKKDEKQDESRSDSAPEPGSRG